MEEDIKILEEFKTKGYSMLLMKYGDRNTTNLKIEQALENLIKGYRKLKLENQALENTKNTCPMMNTSGIRCNAKEKIKEIEKENKKIKSSLTNTAVAYADSTPKSFIKEKIEEYINSILENLDEDRRWCDIELVDNFRNLEEELLKEDKKWN